MSGDQRLPFSGAHFDQALEGFGFAGRVFVQNQDNVLAVGSLPDLRAKDFGEMDRGNVFDVIVFVDHDCHVVGETRSEERQEKNSEGNNPVKSHKHIRFGAVPA